MARDINASSAIRTRSPSRVGLAFPGVRKRVLAFPMTGFEQSDGLPRSREATVGDCNCQVWISDTIVVSRGSGDF